MVGLGDEWQFGDRDTEGVHSHIYRPLLGSPIFGVALRSVLTHTPM